MSPDTYGILKSVGIEEEFATLVQITMPLPNNEDRVIQHMGPLKLLAVESSHTKWMSEYYLEEDDEDVFMREP